MSKTINKLVLREDIINSPQIFFDTCQSLSIDNNIREVIVENSDDVSIRYKQLEMLLNSIKQNNSIISFSLGNTIIPYGVSKLL